MIRCRGNDSPIAISSLPGCLHRSTSVQQVQAVETRSSEPSEPFEPFEQNPLNPLNPLNLLHLLMAGPYELEKVFGAARHDR
jgi:hypothetical protein